MKQDDKIVVFGSAGMAGGAIVRQLKLKGFNNVVCATRQTADLTCYEQTKDFFSKEKPKYIFLAAAKVGGILANHTYPADFIRQNLQIQTNVIHLSYLFGVEKLLFLGSSCIYPKDCPQPIKEEYLLSGSLEKTNEAYALAKIAGLKMCEYYNLQYHTNFISCMPTNLYGVGDNYHLENSHVLPALIAKVYAAKTLNAKTFVVWGSGKARREFLFADDFAKACILLMEKYSQNQPINIGTGKDITITELANLVAQIVGFKGSIVYDTSRPDGTPQKLLCVDKIHSLGWENKTSLEKGIEIAYNDFLLEKNK